MDKGHDVRVAEERDLRAGTIEVDHVLLTRFNLPSTGHESLVRAKENWLRDRVELFERYCLPSVLAQTCQNFSWIVYFDPASPGWFLDWIGEHERLGHFHPRFREHVGGAELRADLGVVAGVGVDARAGRILITSNLDNDDSLALDFVARVQAARAEGSRSAVYLGDGLIRTEGGLYRLVYPHNAFCSVRESWDRPVTCWTDWHTLLSRHMPAVVLRGDPGWLQVVHGANVSNRVRGRLTRPRPHRERFLGLLDDLPEPSTVRLVGDRLVAIPVRAGRESVRAGAKALLSLVAGKRGLDRAKLAWASLRRRPG